MASSFLLYSAAATACEYSIREKVCDGKEERHLKEGGHMRILVACEESQRVCVEFRRSGHEAYSCDIQPCSGGHPEWHIQANVIPLLNGDCSFQTLDGIEHRIYGKWDMIIAFPPCTYMANAGAVRMRVKGGIVQERYKKAMEARAFVESYWENMENAAKQTIVLHRKKVDEVCRSVMDAMRDGLPEEAHSIEVLDYILDECKRKLHKYTIVKL